MVPGSTLMYGSSFCIVTRRPRLFSSRPSDDAVRPLPEGTRHTAGDEDVLRQVVPPLTPGTGFGRVGSESAGGQVTLPRHVPGRWRMLVGPALAASRTPAAPRRGGGPWRCRAGPTASGTARRPGPRRRGRSTLATVRPAASSLLTAICWSAKAATWARWVTTRTCWRVARSASARPTATAASPPMPASTSSKTRVRRVVGTGRPGGPSTVRRPVRPGSRPSAEHQAHGQHGPGQLAARGHLAERQGGLAGVGAEQPGDLVARPVRTDLDLEAGPRHGQVPRSRRSTAPARPRRRRPPGPAEGGLGLRQRGFAGPPAAARVAAPAPRGTRARPAGSPAWSRKAITSARLVAVLAPQLPQQMAPGPDLRPAARVVLEILGQVRRSSVAASATSTAAACSRSRIVGKGTPIGQGGDGDSQARRGPRRRRLRA